MSVPIRKFEPFATVDFMEGFLERCGYHVRKEVNRGLCRRLTLKRVRVQTHRRARYARALFRLVIEVREHRERVLREERGRQFLHSRLNHALLGKHDARGHAVDQGLKPTLFQGRRRHKPKPMKPGSKMQETGKERDTKQAMNRFHQTKTQDDALSALAKLRATASS